MKLLKTSGGIKTKHVPTFIFCLVGQHRTSNAITNGIDTANSHLIIQSGVISNLKMVSLLIVNLPHSQLLDYTVVTLQFYQNILQSFSC